MRKILFLLVLTVTLLIPSIVVADSTVWDFDYLENDTREIFGDVKSKSITFPVLCSIFVIICLNCYNIYQRRHKKVN